MHLPPYLRCLLPVCALALLLVSCSSSPHGAKSVTTFAEVEKPPTAVLGISFDDGFAAVHAQALAQFDAAAISTDGENEVRIRGQFWGFPGDVCFSFPGPGRRVEWVIVTVDAPPAKLLEVVGRELQPGAPYLFTRTDDGATWHWSYSGQALFDVELQATTDGGSRVVYSQLRREVERISPRSNTDYRGPDPERDLEGEQTE